MKVVDKIKLNLKGTVVELDMSSQFIENVRTSLNLHPSTEINEMHVKTFLVGAMRNALVEN